mmetsp:Transcript_46500/g.104171  ORF Transcript_46500/g.104171 Transcript_46500/m.104171 type:complete len:232 (-) Transcript_46500:46-741(-)
MLVDSASVPEIIHPCCVVPALWMRTSPEVALITCGDISQDGSAVRGCEAALQSGAQVGCIVGKLFCILSEVATNREVLYLIANLPSRVGRKSWWELTWEHPYIIHGTVGQLSQDCLPSCKYQAAVECGRVECSERRESHDLQALAKGSGGRGRRRHAPFRQGVAAARKRSQFRSGCSATACCVSVLASWPIARRVDGAAHEDVATWATHLRTEGSSAEPKPALGDVGIDLE